MDSVQSTHPEEKRPVSSKFVELHVLFVPIDQWNVKLNKVPAEAIHTFASGGFIRSKLDALLGGSSGCMDKFFFLKCLGHSLALVKTKQELEVKVKTFAPPYAPQPELYLLHLVESDSGVRPESLTPDSSCSSGKHSCFPFKTSPQPTGPKLQLKLPHIHSSHQGPPVASLEKHHQREERGHSLSEAEPPGESFGKMKWVKTQKQCSAAVNNVLQDSEADSPPSLLSPKGKICKKTKPGNIRGCVDSGMAESSEDRHSDLSKDWANKQEMMDKIKMVREERKQLEWMRQELLRKGKDLLEQNRHRRNQARDSWKKKYFETKKSTAPLEESLKNVQQDFERFYSKLLHQLQARENRGHPKRQGRASVKNELIIQIMTKSYEIENLKRKIEDAKMKLLTEIKLRTQAATEVRSLKAELAQKKSQSSSPRTLTSSVFRNNPRNMQFIHSTTD
uniref:Spermatogenesis-associated protein 1 C-terminal domain-containing protein n=1 Tax=Knipowitschia caucasica TaxID=637954 RepID=A0AAV2KY12_KNICA